MNGDEKWEGCTLEELRQRRARALLNAEIQKSVLQSKLNNTVPTKISTSAVAKGAIGLALSRFSIIKYGFMAYKAAKLVKRAVKLLRR